MLWSPRAAWVWELVWHADTAGPGAVEPAPDLSISVAGLSIKHSSVGRLLSTARLAAAQTPWTVDTNTNMQY